LQCSSLSSAPEKISGGSSHVSSAGLLAFDGQLVSDIPSARDLDSFHFNPFLSSLDASDGKAHPLWTIESISALS
jgi:hypothetical protein